MEIKKKRIGILGGTFDPVHYGHLMIAEQIRQQMDLDNIIFMPSGNPPHKSKLQVSHSEHRFQMVKAAISTNPFFTVSRLEIDREGYTYTVDTLCQLNHEFEDKAQLFFIVGADIIPELLTWKHYEKVFKLCQFIAVLRPGHDEEQFTREIEFLKQQYQAVIQKAKAPLMDISSTDIRDKIGSNKSIKYLVPPEVEEYILKYSLYKKGE